MANIMRLGGGGASGEIDITDNGTFDVKKYATANVNVAPVLLWTNASPTSAFGAQTLTFDGSYDGYLVETLYKNSTATNDYNPTIHYLKVSSSVQRLAAADATTNWYGSFRKVTSVTANSIVFGAGMFEGTSESYNENNAMGIPKRIWGVKFTL